LDFIDVPDRRLTQAAAELVEQETADPGTHVTVVLPRRSYSALLGRLLHDRTADKIAAVVSRIPRSAATIVPYDVESRVRVLQARQAAKIAASSEAEVAVKHGPAAGARPAEAQPSVVKNGKGSPQAAKDGDGSSPAPGATPIGSLTAPGRAIVEGRVIVVEIRPVERNSVLACEINDGTGVLTALFYGRSHIPGIVCGARVRFRGAVGIKNGQPVMTNPAYELLFPAV
ncbi:MAG: OB-fold nucleic acid binding domain-containing protein, partial [Streptosporangiaceae bacterium]